MKIICLRFFVRVCNAIVIYSQRKEGENRVNRSKIEFS